MWGGIVGGKLTVSGRYLERRNGVYYATVYVPPRSQKALGCKVLRRSLKTTDVTTALQLRDEVVAELKAQIEGAETPDPVTMHVVDVFQKLLAEKQAEIKE